MIGTVNRDEHQYRFALSSTSRYRDDFGAKFDSINYEFLQFLFCSVSFLLSQQVYAMKFCLKSLMNATELKNTWCRSVLVKIHLQ
jgi:hypothetical protein